MAELASGLTYDEGAMRELQRQPWKAMQLRARRVMCLLGATCLLAALAAGCGSDSGDSGKESTVAAPPTEPQLAAVPRLAGERPAKARAALHAADLKMAVSRRFSDRRRGRVVSQRPAAGRQVKPGKTVRLVISKGPRPEGPYGVLGTSAIGPVRQGMSTAQVARLFGEPDEKAEVNLGGPGSAAPQIDWIWHLSKGTSDSSLPAAGDIRVQFQTSDMTVTGYECLTPALATASGARVGGPFAPIRERYGTQLRRDPFGGLVLSEGRPGTYPALTFIQQNGVTTEIDGGEPQAAGE